MQQKSIWPHKIIKPKKYKIFIKFCGKKDPVKDLYKYTFPAEKMETLNEWDICFCLLMYFCIYMNTTIYQKIFLYLHVMLLNINYVIHFVNNENLINKAFSIYYHHYHFLISLMCIY